jgi:peptidoglycan/xylan/chitin deacetylase (PgdA/CDA1 family)
MTWEQLREMAAAGMEIGSHTYSHPSLLHLSEEDVEWELATSKQTIEDRIGRPVRGFAYPFGKPRCTYAAKDRDLAERLGYEYAVSVVNRGLRPRDDRWELPRLAVDHLHPFEDHVNGVRDLVGLYNEHGPVWLSRMLWPRYFRASTYGGSRADLQALIHSEAD